MSVGLLSVQNFSVNFDKINWPTFVNGLSYIAWENSISFSPTGANVKSEKAGELLEVCFSGNLARQKLFWLIENIRLFNSKKVQQ